MSYLHKYEIEKLKKNGKHDLGFLKKISQSNPNLDIHLAPVTELMDSVVGMLNRGLVLVCCFLCMNSFCIRC